MSSQAWSGSSHRLSDATRAYCVLKLMAIFVLASGLLMDIFFSLVLKLKKIQVCIQKKFIEEHKTQFPVVISSHVCIWEGSFTFGQASILQGISWVILAQSHYIVLILLTFKHDMFFLAKKILNE